MFPSIKFCTGTSKKIFRLGTVRASPFLQFSVYLDEVTFLPLLKFIIFQGGREIRRNRVNIRFLE